MAAGPSFAVTVSCARCDHLRREQGFYVCDHEAMRNGPALCPTSLSPRTPSVCPLLPAARLALGRKLIGETTPETNAAKGAA